MLKKIIAVAISFCLIFEQSGFAQVAGGMVPGYMANLMPPEIFNPVQLRAISFDPGAEKLSLFLDNGDTKSARQADSEATAAELYKYFQIGLRLPNNLFWVNLRPDSPQNVIDPYLEKTDVGRILLAADLQLKKDLALFTSPDRAEGKRYWDKLYAKAEEVYGQADVEIPTFTRPWIVPGEIIIRESKDGAYIYKAGLQVMLEQDYLKDSPFFAVTDAKQKEMNAYASELLRAEILPKLTRDVNAAKRYAPLRQVYYSLVLAQWFKKKSGHQANAYAATIDAKDLTGLTAQSPWSKDTYYNAYKKSFSEGEYNKEEQVPTASGITIRTYFSGGVELDIESQQGKNNQSFVINSKDMLPRDGGNVATWEDVVGVLKRTSAAVDKVNNDRNKNAATDASMRNQRTAQTYEVDLSDPAMRAIYDEMVIEQKRLLSNLDGGTEVALAVASVVTMASLVAAFIACKVVYMGAKIPPSAVLKIWGFGALVGIATYVGAAYIDYNALISHVALFAPLMMAGSLKSGDKAKNGDATTALLEIMKRAFQEQRDYHVFEMYKGDYLNSRDANRRSELLLELQELGRLDVIDFLMTHYYSLGKNEVREIASVMAHTAIKTNDYGHLWNALTLGLEPGPYSARAQLLGQWNFWDKLSDELSAIRKKSIGLPAGSQQKSFLDSIWMEAEIEKANLSYYDSDTQSCRKTPIDRLSTLANDEVGQQDMFQDLIVDILLKASRRKIVGADYAMLKLGEINNLSVTNRNKIVQNLLAILTDFDSGPVQEKAAAKTIVKVAPHDMDLFALFNIELDKAEKTRQGSMVTADEYAVSKEAMKEVSAETAMIEALQELVENNKDGGNTNDLTPEDLNRLNAQVQEFLANSPENEKSPDDAAEFDRLVAAAIKDLSAGSGLSKFKALVSKNLPKKPGQYDVTVTENNLRVERITDLAKEDPDQVSSLKLDLAGGKIVGGSYGRLYNVWLIGVDNSGKYTITYTPHSKKASSDESLLSASKDGGDLEEYIKISDQMLKASNGSDIEKAAKSLGPEGIVQMLGLYYALQKRSRVAWFALQVVARSSSSGQGVSYGEELTKTMNRVLDEIDGANGRNPERITGEYDGIVVELLGKYAQASQDRIAVQALHLLSIRPELNLTLRKQARQFFEASKKTLLLPPAGIRGNHLGLALKYLSKKIGGRFDSHGIAKESLSKQMTALTNLLENGPNPDKLLYTCPLKSEAGIYLGASDTPLSSGLFIVLSDIDGSIGELPGTGPKGIRYVLVNDMGYASGERDEHKIKEIEEIGKLMKEHPQVEFIQANQAIERLNAIVTQHDAVNTKRDGGLAHGGIDFRALPLTAQPGMNPGLMQPAIDLKALQALAQQSKIQDLDKEWNQIQKQISGKQMPYARMKEYVAVCSERKADGKYMKNVAACLSNILKLEEKCALQTAPEMKELLVIIEASNVS
jgi:hypothetical protein